MKVVEFEETLDKDIGWRKKEISDLYLLAQNNNTNEALLKSLILLLYAHWEGFIKNSSKLYLKYVSDKRIKLKRLETNFHAILIKNDIKNLTSTANSDSIESELKFISSLNKSNKKFKIKIDMDDLKESLVINTEHNLSEKVLRRIFAFTGLKYKSSLETKKECINSHLLASRNAIAHGDAIDGTTRRDFSLSLEDINKLKHIILAIMDSIKEEFSDYASKEFYLINKKLEKERYEQERERLLKEEFKRIEDAFPKENAFLSLIQLIYNYLQRS